MRFMWNRKGSVALVNNGGNIMFKGIIRGNGTACQEFDMAVVITCVAPTRADLDKWLEGFELKEWIYCIREITDIELGAILVRAIKGGWEKERETA